MRASAATILCFCLVASAPVQAAKPTLKAAIPLAPQRIRVARDKKQTLHSFVTLTHHQWRQPGPPPGGVKKRQKKLGRFMVTREYTAQGNETLVNQISVKVEPKIKPQTPKVFKSIEALPFAQIMTMLLIDKLHPNPVDPKTLWQGAIKGMVETLDKNSGYLTPEQLEVFTSQMSGKLGGIGAIFPAQGKLIVDDARHDGPADRAGLRKGDHLLTVDGKPVKNFEEAAPLLEGKPGSMVTLSVMRKGKKLMIAVERAVVKINPVHAQLMKDGIGVVKFGIFDEGATRRVRRKVFELRRKSGGKLKGLVLDLRDNPGGQIAEAVALVNDFIAPGTVVTMRDGNNNVERHKADPSQVRHPTLPLKVLINENSASSSELVAGALRDLGRATLIGSKSYGKGSIQEMISMPDGAGLQLTVAHFYLPGGKTPHKVGLTPDITREQAEQRFVRPRGDVRPAKDIDYVLEEALAQLRGER